MLKTRPFRHQAEIFERAKNERYFALFWEMGLGKSKTIIDVASYLYHEAEIDALFILAPRSVYRNWQLHELPAHLGAPYIALSYTTSGNERTRMKEEIFLDPTFERGRLRVLCMSYNSMKMDDGYEYAKSFITRYKTMIVADESTALKNESTQTAKIAKKLAKRCFYRWIATGTPVAQSPFDIHSQMEFLDEEFWKDHGMRSVTAFRNEFGVFQLRTVSGGRKFNERIAYRRLDQLQKMIEPVSSRLLKEDSTVELPPKTYTLRSFQLSDAQRKAYDSLRDDCIAELSNPDAFIEAAMALTRMTRLQQITSGFVTADAYTDTVEEESFRGINRGVDTRKLVTDDLSQFTEVDYETAMLEGMEAMWNHKPQPPIQLELSTPTIRQSERKIVDIVPPDKNPRLELLLGLIEEANHKVIVWTRFTRDVEIICEALGDIAVRYDGKVNSKDREIALSRFRDPNDPIKVFVANTHAISMGVTLTIAKTSIYYSNSFSLEKRLQSEDRNHRIGQDSNIHIIDIAAEDTVDQKIIEALRKKYEISAQVTGDRLREWI